MTDSGGMHKVVHRCKVGLAKKLLRQSKLSYCIPPMNLHIPSDSISLAFQPLLQVQYYSSSWEARTQVSRTGGLGGEASRSGPLPFHTGSPSSPHALLSYILRT